MEKNNTANWIVSYVDFMTVIMAFFISFTLIATKVAAASELFIVRTMSKIEKQLKKELNSEYTIKNMGYSGIRIILPSEIAGIPMFNINKAFIKIGQANLSEDRSILKAYANKFIRKPKAKKTKLIVITTFKNSLPRYLFIIKDLIIISNLNFHI